MRSGSQLVRPSGVIVNINITIRNYSTCASQRTSIGIQWAAFQTCHKPQTKPKRDVNNKPDYIEPRIFGVLMRARQDLTTLGSQECQIDEGVGSIKKLRPGYEFAIKLMPLRFSVSSSTLDSRLVSTPRHVGVFCVAKVHLLVFVQILVRRYCCVGIAKSLRNA